MNLLRSFDIIDYFIELFPTKTLFHTKKSGKWTSITSEEFADKVDQLSLSFLASGVKKEEIVATIFSYNTFEWNIIDLALAQIGAIHLPVYPTLSDSDYLFILNQAEVRWVFLTDQVIYNKLSLLLHELPKIETIISIEKLPKLEHFEKILMSSVQKKADLFSSLQALKKSIDPSEVCTIIYTSGTTGFPKGVMLTHQNICTNILAAASSHPLSQGHKVLSFLPLCHMYERIAVYQFLYKGVDVFYAESLKATMANMREVQPDGTTVVPRVLEKIVSGIHIRSYHSNFFIRRLVRWSLRHAFKFQPYTKLKWPGRFFHFFADLLIYSSVRTLLGGKLKYIGCGGAPIPARILNFFWACGIPVFEGYGLTECSPLVSLNYPGENNTINGTVGPAVNNVQVKIAENNEILVKGPNVMKAYYKNPELTEQTLVDGWLHTGDLGVIIRGRFVKIVGRKKEMFKTSYGKYIVPQAIENMFTGSPVIDHIVVIGEGRHCAAAIISPNLLYCRRNLLKQFSGSDKACIETAEVRKTIQKEIEKVNRQLGKTEQIRKYLIVPDTWTVETGELSATQKLRRNIVSNKYAASIREMYREDSFEE
jgi:long-chain acyl-CoA synthetase